MRTIRELAQEALTVQDACNLSGVAISFAKAVVDLRTALPDAGTKEINTHHIVTVWLSKLTDLNDYPIESRAYRAFERVKELAK